LLWAAAAPERLSPQTRALLNEPAHELAFSSASLWEVTIKAGLGRADFRIDSDLLLRGLLAHGYREVPVAAVHALTLSALPAIHRDPFDRILIAQARVEGLTLLTTDTTVARYGAPVRLA
jgi:PIN domain nuclease of toxin-antitoxin system